MRKISIGTTLALALTLGAGSVATAQAGNHPERPRAAQEGAMRRGPGGPDAMLLRGITLSPEQQARVAALRPDRRSPGVDAGRVRGGRGDSASARADGAMRAPRAQGTPRTARAERGDTTGMGARHAQAMTARRAGMEKQRGQHVAALRAILTADQRVRFDRNLAELQARRAERGAERGAA
ncbi:MAG: hypothetical protein ACYC2G_15350, partial [Gemmatimonadaceae bacterium]